MLTALCSSAAFAAERLAAIDVHLSCPAQGSFLDGTAVLGEANEEIAIRSRSIQINPGQSGKAQRGWFSEARITSNKRAHEGTLLASGPDYAIVAYGNFVKEGVGGSLFSVVYYFNLKTLKFKRTVTFFPERKDSASEGTCKKL